MNARVFQKRNAVPSSYFMSCIFVITLSVHSDIKTLSALATFCQALALFYHTCIVFYMGSTSFPLHACHVCVSKDEIRHVCLSVYVHVCVCHASAV